ncbi:hypothetical protein HAX54_032078, partial [Datura stramonium]|nr:hypothetical protein [Datura stramonium]
TTYRVAIHPVVTDLSFLGNLDYGLITRHTTSHCSSQIYLFLESFVTMVPFPAESLGLILGTLWGVTKEKKKNKKMKGGGGATTREATKTTIVIATTTRRRGAVVILRSFFPFKPAAIGLKQSIVEGDIILGIQVPKGCQVFFWCFPSAKVGRSTTLLSAALFNHRISHSLLPNYSKPTTFLPLRNFAIILPAPISSSRAMYTRNGVAVNTLDRPKVSMQ